MNMAPFLMTTANYRQPESTATLQRPSFFPCRPFLLFPAGAESNSGARFFRISLRPRFSVLRIKRQGNKGTVLVSYVVGFSFCRSFPIRRCTADAAGCASVKSAPIRMYSEESAGTSLTGVGGISPFIDWYRLAGSGHQQMFAEFLVSFATGSVCQGGTERIKPQSDPHGSWRIKRAGSWERIQKLPGNEADDFAVAAVVEWLMQSRVNRVRHQKTDHGSREKRRRRRRRRRRR